MVTEGRSRGTCVAHPPFERVPLLHPKVALVAGGLGAYWPQFPELLVTLKASAVRISERLTELGADVFDAGFVSNAIEGTATVQRPTATSRSCSYRAA